MTEHDTPQPGTERWIEHAEDRAMVCYRNTSTERGIAGGSQFSGPLALERARVWADDQGLGLLDVRKAHA